MKLNCEVEVVNRLITGLNVRSSGRCVKSVLALGREIKCKTDYFIIHSSISNKCGTKYKLKDITRVFVKFLSEGKATIRFKEPPNDLLIQSEPIQLKRFMNLLKSCITGDIKDQHLTDLSNISVSLDIAPRKLSIRDRSEFPAKGLPRTLTSLCMSGLKLCNFRREILLLKQLVTLDLSNNEIETIPPEFGRMPNLCELHLANNLLGVGKMDWRWLLGPQITKTLRLLDISKNKIQNLPKAIWQLQKLITLRVDTNSLTQLPSALGRINTLRFLKISQNSLESLPGSLLHCPLEHIDLSSNQFHNGQRNKQSNKHITNRESHIFSLVHIASAVVLKNKLLYSPNVIPWTLVEFLNDASLCECGAPVFSDIFYINKEIDLKEYFNVVLFETNRSSRVGVDCYYCSLKCFNTFT